MATRIGGKYRLEQIQSRHRMKFATDVRLPPADVIDMGETIAATVPALVAETVDDARAHGLDHPILQRLTEILNLRSERCARVLETATV